MDHSLALRPFKSCGWVGGLTQNSVSPVPKKDWALVFWGFDWGLVGTWGLGLGLGLDKKDWALVFLGFDWGLLGTWGLGLGLGLDKTCFV